MRELLFAPVFSGISESLWLQSCVCTAGGGLESSLKQGVKVIFLMALCSPCIGNLVSCKAPTSTEDEGELRQEEKKNRWESVLCRNQLHYISESNFYLKTPLRSGGFHPLSCLCLPLAAFEEGRTGGKSAERCRSRIENEVLFAERGFGNVKCGE